MSSTLTTEMAGVRLQSGEQLLWEGRPRSDRWFQPSDALLIPFSLMWGGFAIFWEASVLANHHARNTILFPLWGIPFVLVGLYLIVGRFFVRHWKLSHTTYAVTDRRALSIAPSFRGGHQESAVWLRSYPHLETRGRRGGRGTLFIGGSGLGPRALLADPGWPSFWSLKGNGIVFFDIDEPRTVYELIQSRLGRQLEQEHR